ncbi:hypothetical protein H1V43_32405 [Streptomyces sp. PSKA54]|uniref:Uncharacterized protein n=1 Tax=Streptomyces himalayensis subsp. aureolus TaxID=2758039 RepID=A0A7W2HJC5_9ACTN|nr:DUF6205 family protein [Streptomyces himalayensis]MBA4865966.1 hypothetical protein [Streptomyces himalayensis subsp. aureolus]
MGYITRVTGEFGITPPLTWTEIKSSPFEPVGRGAYCAIDIDLALRVEETSVDTEEGTLVRRTASALVMPYIDEYRARDLIEQVQRCLDLFPGHTFTGRLECEGEENTDLWRVVIRDGRAVRIEPRIVWPDEEATSA